jgi:hypothetical protein
MSIQKRTIKKYISLAIVGSGIWVSAVAVTWQHSRPNGGEQSSNAQQIVKEIASSTRLTPACFMLAKQLAEAGLKARAAQWFPSSRYLSDRENVAADHYEVGRCPQSALLGISYGVAEASHTAERTREHNRLNRWR